MNIFKNKTFYLIFGIISIYIIFVFFSDISKISEHLLEMDIIFLLIILPIEICAFFLRSIRQKILLENIGINISLKENFKMYVAGLSMTVTPGGSGNIIKSHFLKKYHNYSNSKTIPLVFVERFHDLLAVTTIISLSTFFFYLWQSVVLIIIALIFLIFFYSIFRSRSLLEKILSRIQKIKFLSKFAPSLEFSESLVVMTKWKITIKSWAISFSSWFIEVISFYFVFKAFGINLNFIEIGQLVYTSILVGSLSFLPGGLGFTEVSLISLLVEKGYELSIITTLVLMLRIVTIWFATSMGFIFVQRFIKN